MRLLTLALRNFKGAANLVVTPNGENFDIYGQNGSGKTTVADALLWLLFGKDTLGRQDYDLKTRDADGTVQHQLEHEVVGEFEIEDGKRLTLRRRYTETWENIRGNPVKEFTGHTTDYWINSVPVKAGDYKQTIDSICSEQRFRALTDPSYFASLKWMDRRNLLFSVCGNMTDEEVMAATPELAKLPAILEGRKVDDHKKVVASRRAEAVKELNGIPGRIDEANRNLTGAAPKDPAAEIAGLQEQIQALEAQKLSTLNGGGIADLKIKLATAETVLIQARNAVSSKGNPARDAAMAAVRAKDAEIQRSSDNLTSLNRQMVDAQGSHKRKQRAIEDLREDGRRVHLSKFEGEETCPACGQALPADKVEAAVSAFNARRAARLTQIRDEGQSLKAEIEKLEGEIANLAAGLETAKADHQRLLQEKVDIVVPEAEVTNYFDDPGYVAAQMERDAIADEIDRLGQDNRGAVAQIDTQLVELRGRLAAANQAQAAIVVRKQSEARVQELKDQEKTLAAEVERLNGEHYLCEQFVRAKVRLLTGKINDRFRVARFTLFRELVNGGVEECCDMTYLGLPPSFGQSINVGLDVIDTLAEHFGFAPMIVIENAEAVTEILPTRGQQIRLIHSRADETLRFEVDTTTPQKALL